MVFDLVEATNNLAKWLTEHGSMNGLQLASKLRTEGFETLEDIISAGLCEEDLRELGVVQMKQRKQLLRALRSEEERQSAGGKLAGPPVHVQPQHNLGCDCNKLQEMSSSSSGTTSVPSDSDSEAQSEGCPKCDLRPPSSEGQVAHAEGPGGNPQETRVALRDKESAQSEMEVAVRKLLDDREDRGKGVRRNHAEVDR